MLNEWVPGCPLTNPWGHIGNLLGGAGINIYIWMFPKIGVPKMDGLYIMENPIKMDDLGVALFLEFGNTHIYIYLYAPETESKKAPTITGRLTEGNKPYVFFQRLSSWWFQQVSTHLKNMLVKLDHFPKFRGENTKNI